MVRVSRHRNWPGGRFARSNGLQCVLYLQQFIRHPGWDLRVFVIGGKVLRRCGAMPRDGWRTNVAQGGTRRTEPGATPDEERLALRAAAAVGAPVAGVDLVAGPDGEWYVLEVNAVPGWRALAPVTGIDVAAGNHCASWPSEYRPASDAMPATGLCVQLACVWEATARKPGNVHRYRDFDDVTYLDFF